MTQLTFLGSCREIGRSGFLIDENSESMLVDYGVKFQNPPAFPATVPTHDLQGVAITHAHLDHSGGVPIILKNPDIQLFCTPATRDLTMLLLRDMYHISKGRLPFTRKDITRLRRQYNHTPYEETFPLGRSFELTLFNAGHIPGSAMVSVRVNGKRVLFTGDFNGNESRLCSGARKNLPKHDVVVTESTYARRRNPDREEIEHALVDTVLETLERGGTVLIPAFAVGRSQEIMCILEQYNIPKEYPIYVDGMARKVNEIILKHPNYIGSPKAFKQAMQRTRIIRTNNDRKMAAQSNGIIISPAGMLKGGASHRYFLDVHDNPNNAIVLVSYQIPGTPGAELLEKKKVTIRNREYDVKAQIMYHHLSSHSDSEGLLDLLMKIPGEPEFHIVHGESESADALQEKLTKNGKTAHVPETDETVEI